MEALRTAGFDDLVDDERGGLEGPLGSAGSTRISCGGSRRAMDDLSRSSMGRRG